MRDARPQDGPDELQSGGSAPGGMATPSALSALHAAATPQDPGSAPTPQEPGTEALGIAGAEGPGAEEPGAGGDGARPPGRRRRRRRRIAIALVSLLVVALVAGAGLAGLERLARSRIREAVLEGVPGLSQDARVGTRGLVLPQVLDRRLDSLSLSASSLTLDGAADAGAAQGGISVLHEFTASFSGVGLDEPHPVERFEASGTVDWQTLAGLVAREAPRLPGLEVSRARPPATASPDDPGAMAVTSSALTMEATLEVEPEVTAQGVLVLTIVSASAGALDLDLSGPVAQTSMDLLGLEDTTIEVGPEALPGGLSFSRAQVEDTGLRIDLAGAGLALSEL